MEPICPPQERNLHQPKATFWPNHGSATGTKFDLEIIGAQQELLFLLPLDDDFIALTYIIDNQSFLKHPCVVSSILREHLTLLKETQSLCLGAVVVQI